MKVFRNEDGVPCVEVPLDKPRRLAFDMAAIERAANTEGVGLEIFDRLADDDASFANIPTLVWVGLASNAPDVERDRVRRMIHLGNFSPITQALAALVLESFPEAVPLAEAPPEKKPAEKPKAKAKAKAG